MAEPTDVVELLIQDHRDLNRLLGGLDQETRPAEIQKLFSAVLAAIAGHETAEESIVFPSLIGLTSLTSGAGDGVLAQHDEINQMLADMRFLDPAGVGFEKRSSALVLQLRRHFEAEEEVLFPILVEAFSAEERAEMGRAVLAAKASPPVFPITQPSLRSAWEPERR
jgi:hemerythrin superfamily protein